jgi:hypothetical protein
MAGYDIDLTDMSYLTRCDINCHYYFSDSVCNPENSTDYLERHDDVRNGGVYEKSVQIHPVCKTQTPRSGS